MIEKNGDNILRNDGKSKFYRQCNLDKPTRQTIKAFRKIKKYMLDTLYKKGK